MRPSERVNEWLTIANQSPSLRGRIFTRMRMRIDLTQYQKLREGTDVVYKRLKIPEDIEVCETILNGVRTDFIFPQGAPEDRWTFNLHGGGFVMGSGAYSLHSGIHIARAVGCRTVSVDYRLAPENPLTAALDDTVDAYMGLLEQGAKPENIVLYGVSAGGGLCLSLCHTLKERGEKMPAAIVALSPPTDLSGSGESRKTMLGKDPLFSKKGFSGLTELLRANNDPNDPRLSPAFGDFTGFPPIRIYTGERELLLSDSLMVGERAHAQGVDVQVQVWKRMFHAFPIAERMLPESRRAMREIAAYIRERLGMGNKEK